MSPVIGGWEIAWRIALTLAAGGLIGTNRGEHGRTAGLRTTVLVSLAACLSMIQVNLLLPVAGKAPDSFVVMDLMRLPLGILSGMGFIGAGAIVRKGNLVQGVTTAATLWFVTVLGLCFGGGQVVLGTVSTLIGWMVLWALKRVEKKWVQRHRADLTVVVKTGHSVETEAAQLLASAGIKMRPSSIRLSGSAQLAHVRYLLTWDAPAESSFPQKILQELARHPGVESLQWRARV